MYHDAVEDIAASVPWMIGVGNHERDSPYTSPTQPRPSHYTGHDSGGECGVPTEVRFPMPAHRRIEAVQGGQTVPVARGQRPGVLDAPWYAWSQGPVRFIMMSTEHDFDAHSPQYAFIESTLASTDRAATPWLVIAGHRPMYVDSNYDDGAASDQPVSIEMRQELEHLLYTYKCDLALWGHHHSWQRTCPIYNEVCTPGATTHVLAGMAGYSHSPINDIADYFVTLNSADYGIGLLEANRTHLHVQFKAQSGAIMDDFTLTKE